MSSVTVRFVHRETHTPVMEVEVAACTTVGALRELLVGRLASDEHCMMRVFTKWHTEAVLAGGQKRLVELTAADEDEPLHSLGISHLSEVHLEGPLTGDGTEGLGQSVGVLFAQMRSGFDRSHTMLVALLEGQEAQRSFRRLLLLPNEADGYRRAIEAEEGMAFPWLRLLHEAEAGYSKLYVECAVGRDKLTQLCNMTVPRPPYFTIDRTTTPNLTISEDGTTATMISEGRATFRTSEPLSQANHGWAVRMVNNRAICVGLLPKLSDDQMAKIEGSDIDDLGGWSIWCGGAVFGKWHCDKGKLTFKEGDLVTLDFSFAAKTLTISCNGKTVVGHIPSIKEGDELYPAVGTRQGAKVSLEKHPN